MSGFETLDRGFPRLSILERIKGAAEVGAYGAALALIFDLPVPVASLGVIIGLISGPPLLLRSPKSLRR